MIQQQLHVLVQGADVACSNRGAMQFGEQRLLWIFFSFGAFQAQPACMLMNEAGIAPEYEYEKLGTNMRCASCSELRGRQNVNLMYEH